MSVFYYGYIRNNTPTYVLNSFSCQNNVNKARGLLQFMVT